MAARGKVDSTVWLLPEGQWPAAAGGQGIVQLRDQKVFENLVRPDVIDARGVSDPWSTAYSFAWRLGLQDPAADALLWLLLLARYLNVTKDRRITLKAETSTLQRVLVEASPLRLAEAAVTIFEWCDPAGEPPVVACGLWPVWTIFPSAYYQRNDGARIIRDRLLALHGTSRDGREPLLQESGPFLIFRDPREHEAFLAQLAGLARRPPQVATDGPWYGRLLAMSQDVTPAAGAEAAPPGLVYSRIEGGHEQLWTCYMHDTPWGRDLAASTISISSSGQIWCATHGMQLYRGSHGLTLHDLGVARVKGKLIVWKDAVRDPNVTLTIDSNRDVTLSYINGATYRPFDARVLELKDVTCQPAPLIGGVYGSALPLQTKYLDLLDAPPRWLSAEGRWRVELKGRGGEEVLNYAASGDTGAETGIVLWPRERPADWRADVVVARHQFALEAQLVERLPDGTHELTSSRHTVALLAEPTQGVAAYVAFRKGGMEQGVVPLLGRILAPPERAAQGYLAIDFGTTNSVILMAVEGRPDLTFSKSGVPSIDEACSIVVSNRDFTKALADTLDTFHGTYEVEKPSDLMGTLLLRKPADNGGETQWSVIPRDPALVKNYRAAPDVQLLTNLKWQKISHFDSGAVEAYLHRVLLPAFLYLRRAEVAKLRVAITYPLAFENQRRAKLRDALVGALDRLAKRTGMDVPSDAITMLSESHSGIHAVHSMNEDYSLTLDMGGGTTDIALIDREGAVLVADSLQIGARGMLAVITSRQKNIAEDLARRFKMNGAVHKDIIETLIESILQTGGVEALQPFISSDLDLPRRRGLAALLAAVVVVTKRLLSAAIPAAASAPKRTVKVYLLGQGWGLLAAELIRGLSEKTFLDALGRACSAEFILKPQHLDRAGAARDNVARKKLVVEGAMELLRSPRPVQDKQPVSFLGMDLRIEHGKRPLELRASQLVGQHVISRLANGDPGFGAVIDDLLKVMQWTTSPEFPVGDPRQWLEERDGQTQQSKQEILVNDGCHALQSLEHEEGGNLLSPLVVFISRVWTPFWLRTLNGA